MQQAISRTESDTSTSFLKKFACFIWISAIFCGPLRGFGEQGNEVIYFRRTKEPKPKTDENMVSKAIWGNKEPKKSRF